MINRTMVNARCDFVLEALTQLQALGAIPRQEFLSDPRTVGAAESFLRRSLEAIFDVGRYLLAKTGHAELAKEYKSIAMGLVTRQIVPSDFGPTLVRMAGYRNRLVHFYHEVTPDELYGLITAHRGDLSRFVRYVRDYLNRLPTDPTGQEAGKRGGAKSPPGDRT